MLFVGVNLKKWNASGVKRNADVVARRRVLKAASYLQQRIRRNIRLTTRVVGPSKPGEYPHRVTGHLHKTVFRRPLMTRAGPAQDVGTRTFYGVIHEVGVRPFITRTYHEQYAVIMRILAGGPAPAAPRASKLSRRMKRLQKRAKKYGKKAKRYGKKASRYAKRYGKKAKRLGKRYGKKATRFGKRYGKKAKRYGKKYGKRGLKSLRRRKKSLTKSVKKTFKGIKKRAFGKKKRKRRRKR